MIQDKTLDEALVEIMRTKRALELLRAKRNKGDRRCPNSKCIAAWRRMCYRCGDKCAHCGTVMTLCMDPGPAHAAAKRASLDLTRKLAELRAGK